MADEIKNKYIRGYASIFDRFEKLVTIFNKKNPTKKMTLNTAMLQGIERQSDYLEKITKEGK